MRRTFPVQCMWCVNKRQEGKTRIFDGSYLQWQLAPPLLRPRHWSISNGSRRRVDVVSLAATRPIQHAIHHKQKSGRLADTTFSFGTNERIETSRRKSHDAKDGRPASVVCLRVCTGERGLDAPHVTHTTPFHFRNCSIIVSTSLTAHVTLCRMKHLYG